MNILSICLTAFLSFFLLLAPRRFILLPLIMAASFVPMNQRLVVLGLNFTILRILLVVGILRVIMRGETRVVPWNTFDKLILKWGIIGSLVYIAQQVSFSAVIYKSGVMLDSLGTYWLFRHILYEWEDVFQAIKNFAIFAIVTAPFIALEKYQETSFFSIFGPTLGQFHRGRYRAAGPFPHFIMMGCFWASLVPFFYAQIKINKDKTLYLLAILSVLSNVYFSASSTPFITVIAIIFFWNIYRYRMYGKALFWMTSCGLFFLHMIMQAPLWHLMARGAFFSGSTSWYRYFLFDEFVKHTSEWFFLGTKSTAHWGAGLTDITNQFVLEAVRGGIVTLVVFVIILYCAVKIPGKFSLDRVTPESQWISWGICVSMLGHFVTFWGVSYFGQINMLLFFTFALVGFTLEQSTNKSLAITSPQ
jgi:hypothetical protein